MPELDDAALERRLRGVLQEHLGALPLDLTVDALDRRREAQGVARRSGHGRSMTLLAAAALLLVGGALAAGSGLLRLPSVVPPVPAPSLGVVATASPDTTSPSPSESAAPSARPIPVAGPGGAWVQTGSMVSPLGGTAVRLLDGRVLMVGDTSAELYDPATGTWSVTGSISDPLVDATLLRDGRVLVLIGHEVEGPRTAEVYDPANGTWTATGPMAPGADKLNDKFTVLRDGRVLVAGSEGAQVYDPASGIWTATGPMVRRSQRSDTFTVLQDGRVLVVGADVGSASKSAAQVYDPASGTWTATGKMNDQGYLTTAALLSDGKVLVAGGWGFRGGIDYYALDSAQVYDPVTGSWTAIANMRAKTRTKAALLQPDGKVLVVGDLADRGNAGVPEISHSHAEVYDPVTGIWAELPERPGSWFSAATLLSDGAVLVTGDAGRDADQPTCIADLYDPHTGSWTTGSTMLRCNGASFTLLLDGTVLKAGGDDCNDQGQCISNGAAELYVPAGVPMPPFSFPSPPPPVFPDPTPTPTPPPLLPPADGPVPPNARSWTVTVENDSSEPATMFVAEGEAGAFRLVGSATPNVVPAGTTMQVTFLFPAKGVPDDGWISVNPRQGEGADVGSVGADNIGMPGKVWITPEGDSGWVGPA